MRDINNSFRFQPYIFLVNSRVSLPIDELIFTFFFHLSHVSHYPRASHTQQPQVLIPRLAHEPSWTFKRWFFKLFLFPPSLLSFALFHPLSLIRTDSLSDGRKTPSSLMRYPRDFSLRDFRLFSTRSLVSHPYPQPSRLHFLVFSSHPFLTFTL